jgi:hypothetical protein
LDKSPGFHMGEWWCLFPCKLQWKLISGHCTRTPGTQAESHWLHCFLPHCNLIEGKLLYIWVTQSGNEVGNMCPPSFITVNICNYTCSRNSGVGLSVQAGTHFMPCLETCRADDKLVQFFTKCASLRSWKRINSLLNT